jgi:hypothetical protein
MFVGFVTRSNVVVTSAGQRAQENKETEWGGTFYQLLCSFLIENQLLLILYSYSYR